MKLAREDLLSLACDDQERSIARHIPKAAIGHISRFPTREERQFAFRCFWVPFEMFAVCEKAFLSPKGQAWRVGQFALVFAHSRMLKELLAWGQDPRVVWWKSNAAAHACNWWMARYDSYLCAINASYCYWMKRNCPDCCHEQPELAAAARFGFLQRADVGGLQTTKCVNEILAKMKEREQHGSRESEFFHKYANPKGIPEPRWDYLDIDLWLIEMWPLVKQYGWSYREVCDLAFNKFGGDAALVNAAALHDPRALKERCRMMNLRLSPVGQERKGRPKKSADHTALVGFGEVYEQISKYCKKPDPEIDSRGKAAHQALAEMAVNMEPLTRLLAGASKEGCPFAAPNLKIGGKKTGTTPPFFVDPAL